MVPGGRSGGWKRKGSKLKKLILLTAAILFLAGCGADVGPGKQMEDEITRESPTLEEEWPDFLEALVAAGRPVEDDVLCASYSLQATDSIVVLEVESDDFDPVMAIVGEDDELLAINDDWDDEPDARLVLDRVPLYARLMVFSPASERGFFELDCRYGDQEDLEEFQSATAFREGCFRGYKSDDNDDDLVEDFLEDSFEDEVAIRGLDNATIVPFEVEIEQLVSVELRSDEFDPYLVLVKVDDDEYEFLDYNDDAEGLNSRISRELEAGSYCAIVLSYEEEDGDFELELETYSEEDIQPDLHEAPDPGVIYEGQIKENHSLVLAYWPNVEVDAPWEVGISLTSPAAAFGFAVQSPWIYDVEAFADFDVNLTLLRTVDEEVEYVAWNDDFGEGTDSRITQLLQPGDYVALVCSYQDSEVGEVGFSFQEADVPVVEIVPGDTLTARLTADRPYAYYSFEPAEDATSLLLQAVSAGPEEMDPVISLVGPDGGELSDDDGGDGYNAELRFYVDEDTMGTWLLSVWDYSGTEGSIDVILRADTTESLEGFSEEVEPVIP